MVAGRPTREAGLKPPYEGTWSLVGRSYGEYRDVLQTLKRIRDYNPDASLAVWNMLRLANPGHQVQVFSSKRGRDGTEVIDEQGQQIVDELAGQVGSEYGGGLDTLINVLNLTLMTQGAIAAEVELSDDLRQVLDYCPVDPRLIDFARDDDGKAVPVVLASGTSKRVNMNQFRYIPLDPEVDDPHGRSPMWSALEVVFFQMEVLRDLKAVTHNQGYPRLDISVLEEIVVQNTPEHLKMPGRDEQFRTWVDGFLSDLRDTYNSLQPDDTFIHWDWVKVGYVGPGGASGSVDLANVMAAIDAQIVAALKQLPILLGRNEGSTTTHATVQWQIYVAGIEALQRITKRMVEWLHNTALRVYGRQSYARLTFNAIRKADREAEARAARLETDNLVTQVLAGWIDNDEAAQKAVGHEARGVMMILPPVAGEQAVVGSRQQAGQRMLQLLPPEGVADWLWERTKQTGRAYARWAQTTFDEKMSAYLSEVPVRSAIPPDDRGDGDGAKGG